MKKLKYKIDKNNTDVYPLAVYIQDTFLGVPFWNKVSACKNTEEGLDIIERSRQREYIKTIVPIYREFDIYIRKTSD